MKKISVLGLGYIGLPTAILAAENGYDVFGFDIDEHKIATIASGKTNLVEPEIIERLNSALKNKNLHVSNVLQYSDCFIIAVPTPIKHNKNADLSYVMDASRMIATRLMPGNLVIVESTIPVGTMEAVASLLEELSGLKHGVDFFTSHCPERVLPGKIFKELVENDRIIGGSCQKACELSRLFYARFVKGFLHITDDKTAEMVKLVENSSRDVQLAFANQVGAMCNKIAIDPYKVIELANRHPRVSILSPTCGVGGHCIAVDPWFLIQNFPQETQLLKTARAINDAKPLQVIEQVLEVIAQLPKKKPIVVALGLTFKPNVEDLRESPALLIAEELSHKKDICRLIAFDPYAEKGALANTGIETVRTVQEGINQADIILILVKHKDFIALGEQAFANKMVIDTCGLLYDIQKNQAKDMLKGAVKIISNFEQVTF